MTDSSDTNKSKQNWIKDVLSKSGTEIMEIAKIKKGAAKKNVKESQDKMVYYQSTPLVVKMEPHSQAQFCAPEVHHQQQQQIHQQNTTQNYNISIGAVGMHHELQYQQHQETNLTCTKNESSGTTSIKSELITPIKKLFTNSCTSSSLNSASGTLIKIPTLINSVNNTSCHDSEAGVVPTLTETVGRKTTSNKPQFKCEQCGMTFGSKSAHTSHTKSHAKNGELSMHVGSGSSIAASIGESNAIEVNEAGVPLGIPKTPQIKPNISGAPGADPYQCNVCQKTFAVPARLIRHYRTHTGERPFECEFCHKLFSVKENLQVHRRIHTKERPYKCDVCGRAFEHSGKLHRHMRIHTGERPHKCSVCEKTFIQSGQLVIHMRTHTGEKPYKCPVDGCGKGFTCSKQLKVHSRTHTGEKPYHCDICFRDFGYNHVLKLHRVQHYGSKCYKCTICDETFKNKKEMEAHIKGHANELPDEDEGETAVVTAGGEIDGQTKSLSSGSGADTIFSSPSSPQSPVSSNATATNPKKLKQERKLATSIISHGPTSPGTLRSTYSPTSSQASATRFSTGSPVSFIASPTMSITLETDYYNHDTGAPGTTNNRQMTSSESSTLTNNTNKALDYGIDDMPTDLSVQQTSNYYQKQQQQQQLLQGHDNQSYHQQKQEQQQQSFSFKLHSLLPEAVASTTQQEPQTDHIPIEPPTINPALLEAASIASRRAMLEPREEDVTQAALQIMQLHRSQQKHQQQQLVHQQSLPTHHASTQLPLQFNRLVSDLPPYDDTSEANELIAQYKRGELAKRYAPVPKFESSFLNNEIIVRQVEAAIAPLRSSTESPERSSSPESDSMMMADRDVMTLPLRKRKLYMNERPANEAPVDGNNSTSIASGTGGDINIGGVSSKVMRMSSVIQFAKAS